MNFELETDEQLLGEVSVVARKRLESVNALRTERINSNVAIQNIGVQEMSIKGLSNVEEGVKKITSVSLNNGQLFVRGLGDRYKHICKRIHL